MIEHINTRTNGANVFWSASPASRSALIAALDVHGLADRIPGPPSHETILGRVLASQCSKRSNEDVEYKVYRRSNPAVNGFEIHEATRGDNSLAPRCVAVFAIRYGDIYPIHKTPNYADDSDYGIDPKVVAIGEVDIVLDSGFLQAFVDSALRMVPGAAIGRILAGWVDELHGVALRPSGGFYWLPEEALDAWRAFSEAIQEASAQTQVWQMAIAWDADAIEAVRDAVVREVTEETKRVREELTEGDLGQRGIETRRQNASNLLAKVEKYEAILGVTLGTLRTAISVTEEAASAALALQEDNEIPNVLSIPGISG